MTQLEMAGMPPQDYIAATDRLVTEALQKVRDDLKRLRTERDAIAASIRELVAQEEHLSRLESASARHRRTRERAAVPVTEAAPTPRRAPRSRKPVPSDTDA